MGLDQTARVNSKSETEGNPKPERRAGGREMRDQVTSARSTELLDRSVRNKRVLLVSAAFGYVMFFMAGTDTGLGVLVRNPELCLAAAGCALVATFWSSKKQRWI